MEYTTDQKLALTNLEEWGNKDVEKNSDLEYTLNGSAGTGKTTIVKEFLKTLNYPSSRVVVTAPTHKAKKQIEDATGVKGTTIQKILGLRPNTNLEHFNINRPQFDRLARPTIKRYSLIIVDESSMLNSGLYNYITTSSIRHRVKVLYIGDSYQLPPVGERMSKVFTSVINKSILTTIVRQGSDNPMSKVLHLLRDDIKLNTDKGIQYLIQNKSNIVDNKGYECLLSEGGEFGGRMLKYFYNTEYQHNPNYMKFITYTNNNVVLWSEGIRKKMLGDASENLINNGEILLGYQSVMMGQDLLIENSAEYTIIDIFHTTSKFNIDGFEVVLEDDEGNEINVFIVSKEGISDFRKICMEKLDLANKKKGAYWKSFYAFKNNHLILEDVYKDPNKPKDKYNLLCKKDLYYNYGLTTHKSQGSTYDNVAINLNNLYICKEASTRARLIYVALSRTKNINLIMLK